MSDDLDRLLARGRLSGAQRERVLDRVLAKTANPRRPRLRYLWVAAPVVAAAAALILVPKLGDGSKFSAKGNAASLVEASCSGGLLSACPIGSNLIFRFDGVSMPAYVQAYATPSPPSAGERIWYFPTSTVPAPQLTASASSGVLPKAVLIGPEHSASAYQITVVLSDHPLTRDDLLKQGGQAIHRDTLELGVVH